LRAFIENRVVRAVDAYPVLGRERLGIDADVLESRLGHVPKDEIDAAYVRVKFCEKRREVIQEWADYLDMLKSSGNASKTKGSTGTSIPLPA